MKCLLNRIIAECKCFTKQGHVATYIPELARRLSGNDELCIDMSVYQSEKLTGNKNRALAYMLTAYNMISDPVEDVLDFYFRACSISANCRDLAKSAVQWLRF